MERYQDFVGSLVEVTVSIPEMVKSLSLLYAKPVGCYAHMLTQEHIDEFRRSNGEILRMELGITSDDFKWLLISVFRKACVHRGITQTELDNFLNEVIRTQIYIDGNYDLISSMPLTDAVKDRRSLWRKNMDMVTLLLLEPFITSGLKKES